jgi:hypothetical protein
MRPQDLAQFRPHRGEGKIATPRKLRRHLKPFERPNDARCAFVIRQKGKPGVFRMILEMFHVKHFCPKAAGNLTSSKTAPLPGPCRIDRNFGAMESGGGDTSIAEHVAGNQLRCKFGINPRSYDPNCRRRQSATNIRGCVGCGAVP